jgi:MFS family permease
MGIVGICNNIGNAIGWVFGSQCTQTFGLTTMFIIAASLGSISLWMFKGLKESIPNKNKFQWSMLKLKTDELIEKRVLLPGLILLLTAFTSGSILSLIADFSSSIGVKNKGLYMAIYILSSLIIRFMAGRWSDLYGRKKISLYGAFSLFISMMLLAYTDSFFMYTCSSVLFGVGFGLLSPSLFAWAVDISIPGYKGRAVGTLFIFLELGIILGSSVGGLIYNNQEENFKLAFIVSALLALSAVVVLIFSSQKFKSFRNR